MTVKQVILLLLLIATNTTTHLQISQNQIQTNHGEWKNHQLLFYKPPNDAPLATSENCNPFKVRVRFDESSSTVMINDMEDIHKLTRSVPLTVALRPAKEFKQCDIVKMINLKSQQNKALHQIVTLMNNSYGIVMANPIRQRMNKTEIKIEWILSAQTKAGIRRKYLKRDIPNIFIHDASKQTIGYFEALSISIQLDKNKDLLCFNLMNANISNSDHLVSEYAKIYHRFRTFVFEKNNDAKALISWIISQVPQTLLTQTLDSLLNEFYGNGFATKIVRKIKQSQIILKSFSVDEREIWMRDHIKKCLDMKERNNLMFWNKFIKIMMSECEKIMSEKLMNVPLKYGTAVTMDIANYYLMHSMAEKRDLHVLITEKEDLRDIDFKMIVDNIASSLDVGGIKQHLARNIMKRVFL